MDERQTRRADYRLTIPDALLSSEAMRRACATRNFREIFRLVNRRTGSSHADMAAAIGKMTSSRVSDIIRGVRGIRGQHVIERVADGFGIPGEMLDLPRRPWEDPSERTDRSDNSVLSNAGSAPEIAGLPRDLGLSAGAGKGSVGQNCVDAGDLDEMIRREFLRLTSIASVMISAAPTENNSDNVNELVNVGDAIGGFECLNSHLWQAFSLTTSKRTVYPIVREQLNALTSGLKTAADQETHGRLCVAAGDLFQLAGEIFFDDNRYTDAAHLYALAASASKEAEQYDLWACALTRHAFIGMYENQYSDAAPLLEAAQRVARRGDSQLSTRYWVAAVQAEVFARLGDFDACCRSLDKADEVRSLAGDVHTSGWLRFDGSRLAEERGTCYVALNRPDLAEAALMDASKRPLSSRRRGSVLIDLAILGIQRRDIDQLISYAEAAIELFWQTHSGYMLRKLQGLQTQLRPLLSDGRVSNLAEQVLILNHFR